MSLVSRIKGNGPSGFGYGTTAEVVTQGISLKDKQFLVTGSTSGLGIETVRVLAQRGARVFATGRTKEKVLSALGRMPGTIVPLECELSEPKSVRACVSSYALESQGRPLDGIIANAGVMALPTLELTHGYERQFFTNHIGHFLLITGLLPALAEKARVVVLSSDAHRMAPKAGIEFDNLSGQKSYSPWRAYGQSKLANLLFAKQLAKRLASAGSGVTANALHPGVIVSGLQRSMPAFQRWSMAVMSPIALKSIAEGAATQVYVATRPELDGVSGEYFADCNIARPSERGRDSALAERLWQETEQIVAKFS
ncbi:MAG TPA: SDR family oxidoreductase [Polyangiaceae bacterium]|nr:SDR family oxidoreductase [Polyangiaceae bacterium]